MAFQCVKNSGLNGVSICSKHTVPQCSGMCDSLCHDNLAHWAMQGWLNVLPSYPLDQTFEAKWKTIWECDEFTWF